VWRITILIEVSFLSIFWTLAKNPSKAMVVNSMVVNSRRNRDLYSRTEPSLFPYIDSDPILN
jgi:hypothetical protein